MALNERKSVCLVLFLCSKEMKNLGNNLRDQLNQWKKKNNQPATPAGKKSEKLSQRDLMDLMGTNKRGYTRKRGVIRQK